MPTTIITKFGTGTPPVDQVQTGELAIDMANQILYTKDASNPPNIIQLGGGEVHWNQIIGIPDEITNIIDINADGYVNLQQLNALVLQHSGEIADLETDLSNLTGRVDKNETNIGLHGGRLDVLEDAIYGDKGIIERLGDIESDINSLQTSVSNNSQGIIDNTKEIETIKGLLDQDLTGLALGGTYSVEATSANNTIVDVTGSGFAHGFQIGDRLNAHMSDDDKGWYFVVQGNGELSNLSREGSNGAQAQNGDWLVSDGTHGWILMSFGGDHVTWGSIGGNIENQTDLMEYLEPYYQDGDTIDCGEYR